MFRRHKDVPIIGPVVVVVLGLIAIPVFSVALNAQSANPVPTASPAQKEAPVPLLSHYPAVGPQFLTQYPDEPVEKVVQATENKALAGRARAALQRAKAAAGGK